MSTKLNSSTLIVDGDIITKVPNTNAILDLTSTDKALLVPRMTTEANVITPANGMIVYNTTTNKFRAYEGGAWVNLI